MLSLGLSSDVSWSKHVSEIGVPSWHPGSGDQVSGSNELAKVHRSLTVHPGMIASNRSDSTRPASCLFALLGLKTCKRVA